MIEIFLAAAVGVRGAGVRGNGRSGEGSLGDKGCVSNTDCAHVSWGWALALFHPPASDLDKFGFVSANNNGPIFLIIIGLKEGTVTPFWSMRRKKNFAGRLSGKFSCSSKQMCTEEVVFLFLSTGWYHIYTRYMELQPLSWTRNEISPKSLSRRTWVLHGGVTC